MCINERFVITPATPEVAVTVEQVYGKPLACLKPPRGYEFTEFRPTRHGDFFLSKELCKHYAICEGLSGWAKMNDKVRLILKKKEPRKVVKHVFTEIGRRKALPREHYWTNNQIYSCGYMGTIGEHMIVSYERIEEMVED